jgi:hypothetical protein
MDESFFDTESRIHYRLHNKNSIGVLRLWDRRISETVLEIQQKLTMLEEILIKIELLITIEDRVLANELLYAGKYLKRCIRILKMPKMRLKRSEDLVLKSLLLMKNI